jgi:hypothetical protein
MPPQQSEGTRGAHGYAALPRRFQYGPPAVLRQTRPSTRVPASPRPTPLLATQPLPRPPLRPPAAPMLRLHASSAGAAHRRPRHPHPGRALRPFPDRPVGWKGRPRDRAGGGNQSHDLVLAESNIHTILIFALLTGGRAISVPKVALSLRQRGKHTRNSLIERDCNASMRLTKLR